MPRKATWINKTKKITGSWQYNWASNTFTIFLNSTDRITGQRRVFITYNDTPEWGNWKLIREE